MLPPSPLSCLYTQTNRSTFGTSDHTILLLLQIICYTQIQTWIPSVMIVINNQSICMHAMDRRCRIKCKIFCHAISLLVSQEKLYKNSLEINVLRILIKYLLWTYTKVAAHSNTVRLQLVDIMPTAQKSL